MSWAARFQARQYLKGSLWVLPVVGGVVGPLLAQVTLLLDDRVQLPPSWSYSPSTASGVLTTIVGAIVALLGFVVTIGVLVIQQATGTLSPRYMRLWYRNRLQKVVLATFVGTLTYAFSLLRRVSDDFVPNIGVTVSGVAVTVSLALLLIYLDRFTHSLRPVAVAALVGAAGREVLDDARTTGERRTVRVDEIGALPPTDAPLHRVATGSAGAIQAVHLRGLVALAEEHDCVVVLVHGVGDFVTPNAVLAEVYGSTGPTPSRVRGLFALGQERTIEQDPAFALRVLVDVAIRALSPAVNDPTTAVQVLDHIEVFLQHLVDMPLPDPDVLADRHGRRRVVVPGRSFRQYVDLALTEIREYGEGSTQVCRRLRALLDSLLAAAPADRREVVSQQLRRLDVAMESVRREPADRQMARVADVQGLGGASAPRE